MTEIEGTVSKLGAGGTTYEYDSPSIDILEWFKFEAEAASVTVELRCPEFTSLCPKTGQPDFANINIQYIPDSKCVESKSLKLYLFAFRNHGEFHESCVKRICKDLVKLLNPKWIRVTGEFLPRGGISIWPVAEWKKRDVRK